MCRLVAIVCLLAASGALGDEPKELQGRWTSVSVEDEGRVLEGEAVQIGLIITGKKVVFRLNEATQKPYDITTEWTIDLTTNPKVVDVKFTDGPVKDTTWEGIWSVEGDELRLCLMRDGKKERPTEFSSKPNSGHLLLKFRRAKD